MYSLSSLKGSLALTLALSGLAACQTTFGPGGFAVYASDSPFLGGPSPYGFFLRPSDGLFCVTNDKGTYPLTATYTSGPQYNPYGVAPGPCSPAEACQLIFQSDGNLVEYYNGAAVWQAGTAGQGAVLQFNPGVVFAQVLDANGQPIWSSNPVIGPPGGCYGPSDQCP